MGHICRNGSLPEYIPVTTSVVTPSGATYSEGLDGEAHFAPSPEELRNMYQPKGQFVPDVPIEAGPDFIDAPAYTAFAEESHLTKAVFGNAQASLAQVHALYSQIEVTEHLLLTETPANAKKVYLRENGWGAGKLITTHERAHEYANDLNKAYKGVLGRVHEKLTQMQNVEAELTKQIEDTTRGPSVTSARDIALASEIRAHVKGLKSADGYDQHALMYDMIEKGYKPGVVAILDAPPFLSGMTAEQQQEYKEIAQAKWAPDSTNQREITRKLIGIVHHATAELHARYHLSHGRMSNQPIAEVSQRLAELRGMG